MQVKGEYIFAYRSHTASSPVTGRRIMNLGLRSSTERILMIHWLEWRQDFHCTINSVHRACSCNWVVDQSNNTIEALFVLLSGAVILATEVTRNQYEHSRQLAVLWASLKT